MSQVKNTSKETEALKSDRKKAFRELIELLLPDSLMIALAIVMVPLTLISLFVDLPQGLDAAFRLIDYVILGIFIIEYFGKTLAAPNIWKHVIDPWHILDLVIIVLPFVGMLPALSRYSFSPLFLRLLRIVRVVALGGRAIDRKVAKTDTVEQGTVRQSPMEIRVIENDLGNVLHDVPFEKLESFIKSPSHTWIDISGLNEDHVGRLSDILKIPRMILEGELIEDSYPRVDYFEHYAMIFSRIADVKVHQKGPSRLSIKRSGVLLICFGQNIITVSRTHTGIFTDILKGTRKIHTSDEPLTVSVLYTILRHVIEKDKQIIYSLENEILNLENIPMNKRPSNFLESTFNLRKEANQIVPSLMHLKEIINMLISERIPLEGFSERHAKVFDAMGDEASYLFETASNARDNLSSIVELHINANSYQMNRVMKVIALITSLGIIPAALGLFGSNIIGNPWNIELWQLFGVLIVCMLAMFWVFYRLGWLK